MTKLLWQIGAAAILLLTSACTRLQIPLEQLPPDLIVASGARELRTFQRPGQIEVDYVVDEPFPATELLATIDTKLRETGWQALPTSPLTGDEPSSQVTGWASFADARRTPNLRVHQWMATWKNASGDLATYALRYESHESNDGAPADAPNNAAVKVVAAHNPAAAAAALVQAAEQFARANSSAFNPGLATEDAEVLKTLAGDLSQPRSFVMPSRAICAGAVDDACVPAGAIAQAKPLPGLRAAFTNRNRTSQNLPAISSMQFVGPEAWTRSANGPIASPARLLWCSLPGYSLGEALVACLERPAGKGAISETLYLLEHRASWWHMKSATASPVR